MRPQLNAADNAEACTTQGPAADVGRFNEAAA